MNFITFLNEPWQCNERMKRMLFFHQNNKTNICQQGEPVDKQQEAVQSALIALFRNGLKHTPKSKMPEMREHVETILDAFKQSTHMNEVLVEKGVNLQTTATLLMHANDHFQKKLQFLQSKDPLSFDIKNEVKRTR